MRIAPPSLKDRSQASDVSAERLWRIWLESCTIPERHNLLGGTYMLGDALGEEHGQILVRRVLPSTGPAPSVEVSFEATGTLLGVDVTDMGTYVAQVQADGTLFGDGQGVLITAEGPVTWRGQGAGRFTGKGTAVSWRGAIYYQTAAPSLARLSGAAAVYEYEVDENGKTSAKTWEWQ
jgi:hypothetical protein